MKNLMKTPLTIVLAAVTSSLCLAAAPSPEDAQSAKPAYLYKATFVRAAPGKLLDLIALYKDRMAVYDAAGDERPFWWRHAEGDQWDLMLLFPMGSYADYYASERVSRRTKAAAVARLSPVEFQRRLDSCSAWKEDVLVMGPPLEVVRKEFVGSAFYHIEIFVALPGKQEELLREREMENAYQVALGRPAYMNFVRDQGAAWDVFSLGCYRDMLHWADTANIPKEKKAQAARQAGFQDADSIGPTMRTLIDMHRDTMGAAIK